MSKNFNGLCCVSYDFCDMAHSSRSKKRGSEDPDSGSEEEVNIDPEHLLKENAELVALIENRDDMLRRAKKSRKELRAVIDESSDKISELESKLLDASLKISSLKATPIVTDEVECTDCDAFLYDLTELKKKYASKLEELDVHRVELEELRSRPAL